MSESTLRVSAAQTTRLTRFGVTSRAFNVAVYATGLRVSLGDSPFKWSGVPPRIRRIKLQSGYVNKARIDSILGTLTLLILSFADAHRTMYE